MNNYSLEPSKTEGAIASVPTTAPPTAPSQGVAPFYVPPNYYYQPYQYPQTPSVQPDIQKVRDWLAWSIISIFLGGLIPGFLPLIFSLICRSKKKKNNINGARTMSTLALVFNIICTIMGVIGLIAIFVYLFVFTQRLRDDI